ncbi:MAG: 50S ribosomal protein L9 [Rhodospirillaceae bacterium]|jgi:large subunit ribosomal protein L9|nr:50S ribosomal protein L9 [Rhodospirillaceae bacterium]MBT3932161.1 50S ribosomal protein L9 [Rhodospirillaceae bacterium]MBT4773850.1 50S ribosomal protein L9 [Rhodospirillaceae bacterium]MBT5357417.1 50S ribosomal protein L9 [Rhodospirillaceae bacterium]MBT5770428.1 50S ribosomal protein L9 [Rhodospirillaceae bacterium]
MDVILLERIEKLGQMGDVVTVKSGYARNFLLPQKKALRATDGNRVQFESQRTQLEAENLKRREEASTVASKIEELDVTLIRQAGDNGQLYGSVSARDIADIVTETGVTIGRGQVLLDRAIKELGLHPIRISLHPEVSVELSVNIARTEDEAATQREHGRSITQIAEDAEEAEFAVALADEALAVADDKTAEAEAIEGMVEDDVAERVAGEAGEAAETEESSGDEDAAESDAESDADSGAEGDAEELTT